MEYVQSSPAGNRTPVSRVMGGDTHRYTTEDKTLGEQIKYRIKCLLLAGNLWCQDIFIHQKSRL